jgi:hypothetical protein
MNKRLHGPSGTFLVALIALFVALGGTAGAVATVVPALAKRALIADNAKKLNGFTASQIGGAAALAGANAALKQSPPGARAASTAASLVSTVSTASTAS